MEIDIKNLIPLINNIKIIDIRDAYKYNLGHIPTSQNINVNYLEQTPEEYLKKNRTYYLYCEYGEISKKLCTLLMQKGYRVINIKKGYIGYCLYQKRL
ncbi:MAG: rhodanese-like domain-containing protein [Tenericutes bacterium]|jgi:rhodanese-related sulfurtransferase|nr:rhodanese-like domain-containing protein [Mycoplasmatota bacterium]